RLREQHGTRAALWRRAPPMTAATPRPFPMTVTPRLRRTDTVPGRQIPGEAELPGEREVLCLLPPPPGAGRALEPLPPRPRPNRPAGLAAMTCGVGSLSATRTR